MPTPSLEARIQALEDRSAIADLVHDYARLVDAAEPEQVAALFTDDARVDFGPGLGGPQQGREAVRRLFRALYGFERTHHHVANHQVRFEGEDRATGIAYVIAWHQFEGDRPNARAYGRYDDEYVRTAGGWRFAARRISLHGHEDFDVPWNWVPRKERPK